MLTWIQNAHCTEVFSVLETFQDNTLYKLLTRTNANFKHHYKQH